MAEGPKPSLVLADQALDSALQTAVSALRDAGGRPLLVGGCVRDALLGRPAKDVDIEVYGLGSDVLKRTLAQHFALDEVGESFGILKLHGLPIDVSIPRRESKRGLGHKGFHVDSDPHLDFRDAAARRDFTINAMAMDPATGEVLDAFGGLEDLRAGVLRHTSVHFSEDPLRVLRAMQFAARFDLQVAAETTALCREIEPEGLAHERVFDEWKKLILQGARPSRGLHFLEECGWIRYYPELHALVGCRQDEEWHPEGDVWVHTLHCMDAFARARIGDPKEDLIVGLAVLCHDLGKPATTTVEGGRIRSPGHEKAGVEPTRAFLARLTNSADLVEAVVPLVLEHMRPVELFEANASDNAVRRLALRTGRIDRLIRVALADQQGRPPRVVKQFPAGEWLLERARAQAVESSVPKPIVMGRHLLELGFVPGPQMGEVLEKCYQAQLDGGFSNLEQGMEYAKTLR